MGDVVYIPSRDTLYVFDGCKIEPVIMNKLTEDDLRDCWIGLAEDDQAGVASE